MIGFGPIIGSILNFKNMSARDRAQNILIFSIFLCITSPFLIYVICFSATKYAVQVDARNWIRTESNVINSGIINYSNSYAPNIRYSFTANNKKYTGNQVSFNNKDFDSKTDASKWLEDNITNNKIIIYYNHKNPQQSVIDNTPNNNLLMGIAISLVFIILGFLGVMNYFWVRKRSI